jgi:hypothetical protein
MTAFATCRTQGLMRELGRRPSVDRRAADAPPAARRPSDASASAASKSMSSTASGSKYELVQSILEDMGSKASSCFSRDDFNNLCRRTYLLGSKTTIIVTTPSVSLPYIYQNFC